MAGKNVHRQRRRRRLKATVSLSDIWHLNGRFNIYNVWKEKKVLVYNLLVFCATTMRTSFFFSNLFVLFTWRIITDRRILWSTFINNNVGNVEENKSSCNGCCYRCRKLLTSQHRENLSHDVNTVIDFLFNR